MQQRDAGEASNTSPRGRRKSFQIELLERMQRMVRWGDRNVPRGLRSIVGVLFLFGGFLSILPIFGLWMFPVGAAMIALDVPPWRRRLLAWLERKEEIARRRDRPGGHR